jgi:hypothetical protein
VTFVDCDLSDLLFYEMTVLQEVYYENVSSRDKGEDERV